MVIINLMIIGVMNNVLINIDCILKCKKTGPAKHQANERISDVAKQASE